MLLTQSSTAAEFHDMQPVRDKLQELTFMFLRSQHALLSVACISCAPLVLTLHLAATAALSAAWSMHMALSAIRLPRVLPAPATAAAVPCNMHFGPLHEVQMDVWHHSGPTDDLAAMPMLQDWQKTTSKPSAFRDFDSRNTWRPCNDVRECSETLPGTPHPRASDKASAGRAQRAPQA